MKDITVYNDTPYASSLLARWAYYFDLIGFPGGPSPTTVNGCVTDFVQDLASDKLRVFVGSHSRDFLPPNSDGAVRILARGLPGPHANQAFQNGVEVCNANFTWYGYVRKRWAEPFWACPEDDQKSMEASRAAIAAPVVSGILVPNDALPCPLPRG